MTDPEDTWKGSEYKQLATEEEWRRYCDFLDRLDKELSPEAER